MRENRRIEDHYTVDSSQLIGEGGHARVFLGVNKHTSERVAIKWINKEGGGTEADLKQAEILHLVDHKHIIQLKDYFDTPDALLLVLEYASGGDVVNRIEKKNCFSEKDAVKYCRQILAGLLHCHKRGIVHCDLKAENILFSSEDDEALIKIADFGFAQLLARDRKLVAERGTPEYIAPEILSGAGYDTAADMWSFGVVVYIILSGGFPFSSNDREALYRKIMRAEYKFYDSCFRNVSEEAKDFIKHLLVADPKKRFTAQQCLQHKWLTNACPAANPLEINAVIKELNKQRARVHVSHCLSSVIIHSDRDAPNREMPLGAAAVTDDEYVGRGIQAVLSLAYEDDEANNLTAASTISNYCINDVYREKLVESGVLRAIVALASKSHAQVKNLAALALFHIAKSASLLETVISSPEIVDTVMQLGQLQSNVIGRQAARVMAAFLRSETHRAELVSGGGLLLIRRLLTSTLTDHHREGLKALESVAEMHALHGAFCRTDENEKSVIQSMIDLATTSDSVGIHFLTAIIFRHLSHSTNPTVLNELVNHACPLLCSLVYHEVTVVKIHAVAAITHLLQNAREALLSKEDPSIRKVVKLILDQNAKKSKDRDEEDAMMDTPTSTDAKSDTSKRSKTSN